jgi:hypothetical protein
MAEPSALHKYGSTQEPKGSYDLTVSGGGVSEVS